MSRARTSTGSFLEALFHICLFAPAQARNLFGITVDVHEKAIRHSHVTISVVMLSGRDQPLPKGFSNFEASVHYALFKHSFVSNTGVFLRFLVQRLCIDNSWYRYSDQCIVVLGCASVSKKGWALQEEKAYR